jgi:glyoxylase-like metal-dependent hydrolase (beta-lactamase superfamily II)
LEDQAKIGSLTVINIPGHTTGSIALLTPPKHLSLATHKSDGKTVTEAPDNLALSPQQAKQSLEKSQRFNLMLFCRGTENLTSLTDQQPLRRFLSKREIT